jgi:shikimate kinase
MGDIRCKTNILVAQDLWVINVSCFQYDLSIEMQNTSFNEQQKSKLQPNQQQQLWSLLHKRHALYSRLAHNHLFYAQTCILTQC